MSGPTWGRELFWKKKSTVSSSLARKPSRLCRYGEKPLGLAAFSLPLLYCLSICFFAIISSSKRRDLKFIDSDRKWMPRGFKFNSSQTGSKIWKDRYRSWTVWTERYGWSPICRGLRREKRVDRRSWRNMWCAWKRWQPPKGSCMRKLGWHHFKQRIDTPRPVRRRFFTPVYSSRRCLPQSMSPRSAHPRLDRRSQYSLCSIPSDPTWDTQFVHREPFIVTFHH